VNSNSKGGELVEGGLLSIACAKIARLDVPAFVKDGELRFVAVNPAFELFSGFDRHALIGQALSTLTGRPEDRALEDMERRALVFAEEQIALCFDETGRDHCRVQIERFVTEDEKLFAFGVFRERPRRGRGRASRKHHDGAETTSLSTPPAAVRSADSATDFPGLLDALPLGLLLLDRDLRIVQVNRPVTEMLAKLADQLRVGVGFDTVVDALLSHVERDRGKKDRPTRQQLLALPAMEASTHQRITLCDTILEVRCQHLAQGSTLLLFSDVTSVLAMERESLLYRSVLENVPEPVFLRDQDRKLVFINAAYEQMLGGDRSRFYGLREDEMFVQGGEKMRLENLQILETGQDMEREQRVVMPNGVDVPILTSLKRIEDVDGAYYIVGTLADISILKVRESEIVNARLEAEALYQRFEKILRTMPVGVVIFDQDMAVSFANSKAQEVINWPAQRLINGASLEDYVRHCNCNGWPLPAGPDPETQIAQLCAEVRNAKGSRQFETMLDDGRYILSSLTRLEHGQSLLTYSDYTEQRLREREITEARARLEDVGMLLKEATHAMTQGLCVFQEGKILYANEKIAEMLNLPASMAVEGADWLEIYDYCGAQGVFGENPAEFLAEMKAHFFTKSSFSAVLRQPDDNFIKLEALISGETRWLVLLSDVTEAKKREAELTSLAVKAEAADRAKSRFLSSMGHEIRTPMSGVLGMAELLSSSDLDARQKTFLDVIIKSGRSLLTIINDILDFAKIDDGSLALRKAPFDPVAAVDDVVLLMAGRAAEKDLELLVRGNGGLKHLVAGDAGRFRQIVTKLLDGAIRATDKGHVLIDLAEEVESDDRLWLTLRVEDTGPGFTPEQKRVAFTKFSQLSEETFQHKAGAGLSLSIVAGLVDLFGGTTALESEAGQGAVFTLRLPLAIAGEKIAERPAPSLQGARVLAVASNPLACGILNEQLLRWGFDGVALSEPELAYTVLREAIVVGQPIELLVVDIHAAGEAMLNLLRKIRQDGLFNGLAIVALTSPHLLVLKSRLEAMNIQAHLQKPVAETSLRNAIVDVLRAVRRAPQAIASADNAVAHATAVRAFDRKVLIVDANEAECDVFRQVLSAEGMACEIFSNEEQAYAIWHRDRPRVMLIDFAQNASGALDFVRFIRDEEARTAHAMPTALIGLSNILSTQDRASYLTAGLDDLLIKPISPARLLDCIRQWSDEAPSGQRLAL
jgi:PAS domain S-box-containing protein